MDILFCGPAFQGQQTTSLLPKKEEGAVLEISRGNPAEVLSCSQPQGHVGWERAGPDQKGPSGGGYPSFLSTEPSLGWGTYGGLTPT